MRGGTPAARAPQASLRLPTPGQAAAFGHLGAIVTAAAFLLRTTDCASSAPIARASSPDSCR
ncbi:hypothetical protein [Streptomyces sp. MN13]